MKEMKAKKVIKARPKGRKAKKVVEDSGSHKGNNGQEGRSSFRSHEGNERQEGWSDSCRHVGHEGVKQMVCGRSRHYAKQ